MVIGNILWLVEIKHTFHAIMMYNTTLYPEDYDLNTTWFVVLVLLGGEQVSICVQDERNLF